jgi:hypothetical protein
MTFVRFFVFPPVNLLKRPLRIHSWGGLGSQIFTCIVGQRMKSKFPEREIHVIFHSSGVTSRGIEVPLDFLGNSFYRFVDDFKITSKHQSVFKVEEKALSVRSSLTRILERFGLLARLNREEDFLKIKPWLVEIRGHYTELNLSREEIDWVSKKLGINLKADLLLGELSLHLRLGDLLSLPTKTPIPVDRIKQIVGKLEDVNRLIIFSDSTIPEIQKVLGEQLLHNNVHLENSPAIEVIRKSVDSEIFIGTNSKISLWIAIIRVTSYPPRRTFLPNEISKPVFELLKFFPEVSSMYIY